MARAIKLNRDCNMCELAGDLHEPATYDAKTIQGPWAYLCDGHFRTHGVRFHTKLEREDEEAGQ